MKSVLKIETLLIITVFVASIACTSQADPVHGWLSWRGPHQNGTSEEVDLPETWEPGGKNQLWTYEIAGRGTPVIANGKAYFMGYRGEGPDLREYITCVDVETGERMWEHGFNDFLSDIVYNRYSIGSPTVDRETGKIYMMTTPGIFACFTPEGDLLWQHSMMEEFGRLSFPNGRTGCPVIDEDLVIVQGITSNWGSEGPGRNRYYAFDKQSGDLVWSSTPGVGPKDSSFSTPVFDWFEGKRVFYSGTGCGNVVCLNARTGEPLWRFQLSYGGINSSLLIHGNDKVIAIHGKENVDTSEIGRMVAIKLSAVPEEIENGPAVLNRSAELWRNELCMFTSSPVLVGDRVYQVDHTGELCSVNANTGEILWTKKLGPDQLHASPLYADGKLYIPMRDGHFYIIKPSDEGAEVLTKVKLEGNCLGSPSVWNGRIFVHTTEKLYCFGSPKTTEAVPAKFTQKKPEPGKATQLQIVPAEVLIQPGDTVSFNIRSLDENGLFVSNVDEAEWEKYIPATAKVKAEMDAEITEDGKLIARDDAILSAGAFQAKADGLTGTIRGRVMPDFPIKEDFEDAELSVTDPDNKDMKFAYPPLPWIGARFKWEIRDVNGTKALAKTLDNVLFQRAITFIGHPDMSNYTVQADVMTDGSRRMMSNVGVINQRYFISLIGNWQQIEVSSNHDRIKVNVPFKWKKNVWYRLKTRVDVADDGSGVVRAKAWERDGEEPDEWLIEVPHKVAHKKGAPGLIGFSPQSRYSVYVDNILVTDND